MSATRWIVAIFLVVAGVLEPSVVVSRGIENPTYCEFYDEACANSSQGCPEKVKCLPEHPDARSHCFVTWHFDEVTNVTSVKRKGCGSEHGATRCANGSICVDENRHRRKRDNVSFCCCTGDMCNKNFARSTKLIERPRMIDPVTEEARESREAVAKKNEGTRGNKASDEIEPEGSTSAEEEAESSEEGDEAERLEKSKISAQEKHEWAIIELFLYVPALVIVTLGSVYWFVILAKRHWCSSASPRSEPPQANAIILLRVKARGNFGAVWKARMGKKIVAVKICSVQNHASWRTERRVLTLPHMNHENLLEFIGADRSVASLLNELWLIVAYHPRGSLGDYLKTTILSLSEVLKIATSILRGLEHLHKEIPASKTSERKPTVAHRDVKSQNVLLKLDMTACLADFGLSAVFHRDKPSAGRRTRVGTRRYMAPELLRGSVEYNRETCLPIDVYACSYVLWEMISRCANGENAVGKYKLPFEDLVGFQPTTQDMLTTVVLNKERPEISPSWRNDPHLALFCDLVEKCWDDDPAIRPTSSDALQRILTLNDYYGENSSSTVIMIEDGQGSSAIEDTT